MVSGCGVINCMFICSESALRSTSYSWVDSLVGTFTPSIPQIAKDLSSTGAVVKWIISQDLSIEEKIILSSVFSIAVSMTVFAASLGALIAASYSTFCKFVVSNLLHNQVTFYLTHCRWTQTCLSMCPTYSCNWFRWCCFSTKYSFSLVLEVFPGHGCFPWSGAWCGCHWWYIQARREGKSYGSFLFCKLTFFIYDSNIFNPIPIH